MNESIVTKDAEKVFIGVDVHRRQYTVTCRVGGAVVKRSRIPGSPEHLVGFMRKFFDGYEIHSAYEAGFSGYVLHRHLEKHGIKNIVVHAASVEMPLKKSKTDKRDSAKISEQLEGGRLRGIQIPSEEQEQRRLISRCREQLMRARTRIMCQLRMRLLQFGYLPLDYRGVLRSEFVNELIERGLPRELSMTLRNLLVVKDTLEQEIKVLTREIKAQYKNDPLAKIYRRVPGFGVLASHRLACELGDLQQFPNERRLFSFAGLIPGEFSSGESRCLGHITRQGRSMLRHILVESAWVAIRKDVGLRETFERIAVRAGKKRAIVAIARKLIGRARALFRTAEEYQCNYRRAA